MTELIALKQYASALERQNQAINQEQLTLYREIQSLQQHNQKLEHYYYHYREASRQNKTLKQQINIKNQQISNLIKKNQQFQQLHQKKTSQDLPSSNKNTIQNLQTQLNIMQARLIQKDRTIEEYLQKIMNSKSTQNKIKQELLQFKKKYFDEKNKNIENMAKIKQMKCQCEDLRYRLQQSEVQRLQNSLQELADNYEKIQLVVLQKEEKAREMEEYINELEYQCQMFHQQYTAKYQYSQQLEYQIQCMQAQLKNKKILGEMSEDAVSMLTESISKIDLIKNHNRMVQKLANLQKQNNNKVNSRQRHSYSQCGQNYKPSSSPSKLQMRINTLKMQNENLIRTLAI